MCNTLPLSKVIFQAADRKLQTGDSMFRHHKSAFWKAALRVNESEDVCVCTTHTDVSWSDVVIAPAFAKPHPQQQQWWIPVMCHLWTWFVDTSVFTGSDSASSGYSRSINSWSVHTRHQRVLCQPIRLTHTAGSNWSKALLSIQRHPPLPDHIVQQRTHSQGLLTTSTGI